MSKPTGSALRLLLRAHHSDGYEALRASLVAHGGDITQTMADLGLSRSTLYRLADADPELRGLLETHGMGRAGASTLGVHARNPAKSRVSKKSTRPRKKVRRNA